MIKVAILRIRHRGCPFSDVTEKFPKIEAYTFSQLRFPDEKNKFLCKIVGDEKERNKYFHAFKSHPLTRKLEMISKTKDTTVMSAVVNYSRKLKSVKSIIESLGCHHADMVVFKEGYEEWVVYNKEEAVIKAVIDRLNNEGYEVKLLKTYPVESWEDSIMQISLKEAINSLSAKQKYIFKIAYSMGYYDAKRKVSLDHIADQLNISKPAVWRHLHRLEEKIMKAVSELI
ncbi:MAG: helix-turn-helix domain-containing protein [Candidatus Methanomethyliaceae archaeon]